jgi:hypothetical protein
MDSDMATHRWKLTAHVGYVVFTCTLALTACGDRQQEDTEQSLARDPERLKAVMQECHNDPGHGNDKRCRIAADANRLRFLDRKSIEPEAARKPAPDPKFASPKF